MPKLKLTSGPEKGREFEFERNILVGRGPLADLAISDTMVSRRHAMLTWENERCVISDLNSAGGTYVNNTRLDATTELRDGDKIRFASTTANFSGGAKSPEPVKNTARVVLVEDDAANSMVLRRSPLDNPASNEPAQPHEDTIYALSRQMRFLEAMGRALQQTFQVESLLGVITDQVLELMAAADRVILIEWDEESRNLNARAARSRNGDVADAKASFTLLQDVIERREGIVYESLSTDRFQEAESIVGTMQSAICVPIVFGDRTLGAIQVDRAKRGGGFHNSDLMLLTGIASQAGMFMAYSELHGRLVSRELIERDMRLAREIQEQFLPTQGPSVHGYSFAFDYSPALAIGGDFYDFPPLPRGLVGIAVGDVSGKGVSAALYVARLSGEVRVHCAAEHEPGEILRRINRALCAKSSTGMFVTMTICALDPRSGEIQIASAGHPRAMVRGTDGSVRQVGPEGDPPLGVNPQAFFKEETFTLASGEVIAWATDGIYEALNPSGELFGEGRQVDAVHRAEPQAQAVLDSVLDRVKKFEGTAPQADDITVICMDRR